MKLKTEKKKKVAFNFGLMSLSTASVILRRGFYPPGAGTNQLLTLTSPSTRSLGPRWSPYKSLVVINQFNLFYPLAQTVASPTQSYKQITIESMTNYLNKEQSLTCREE
uniref:Uncharacterized protein n=1 Tax=Cacopsylla melanoneura TaxID=428564 RepID=A0A8D8TKW6_9HEMI